MTSPPSTLPRPAPLWPPPRTATSTPMLHAKLTPVITWAVSAQRAITAGRLSIMAL